MSKVRREHDFGRVISFANTFPHNLCRSSLLIFPTASKKRINQSNSNLSSLPMPCSDSTSSLRRSAITSSARLATFKKFLHLYSSTYDNFPSFINPFATFSNSCALKASIAFIFLHLRQSNPQTPNPLPQASPQY